MDFVNKIANQVQGDKPQGQQSQQQPQQSSSGGGFMDKLHGLAGGGPESEKKEDALDKGIDWLQEKVFKQGPQTNESAAEQAKDRLIAQQIREQYKNATGKDFPIKEEERKAAEKNGFGGLF
ncbi:hypothetical protein CHGG_04446 [Chaetomium globosum CBS 148.51]|jgi:hypothetical protein|uniref:Uncharacterized protein n=1 Tax=Chaetomium globosum (strain ATCC 6205 / CBS 148.51 / DSM 1962 / NBRC 6347 / NRRL 1970) TaxID=306901 RepID=Q2H1A0_CHAGB|nr:uncharacterized protein CHGG_04446 [Chaetomium globosum CBS 148.51]EAQ87827.1 hypothetical protein CHGG_04446 [Chaetomium globosum CBS 148.51]